MKEAIVSDVSKLPLHGMGTASLTWWGNLAYMLIEGTSMALVLAVYLYLKAIAAEWPLGAVPPDLGPGIGMTVLLVASVLLSMWLDKRAAARDLRQVRWGLVALTVVGVVALVIRVFEFRHLHVSWDDNAYGSVVWLLLAVHTTHLLTDVIESVVLTALMWSRHADNPRRYGDVQDNAIYWNFVVLAWIPIFVCIYGMSRW